MKKKSLALAVCFPQPCSGAGHRFSARGSRLDSYCPHVDHGWIPTDQLIRFHTNRFDEMLCKLDSTENPRSFEKYPTLHQDVSTKEPKTPRKSPTSPHCCSVLLYMYISTDNYVYVNKCYIPKKIVSYFCKRALYIRKRALYLRKRVLASRNG